MSERHVFDTPGNVALHVQLPSGRVVVTTADQPQTIVELVSLGRRGRDALEEIDVRLDERQRGHVITIEQMPRFRLGPIQISWDDAVEARVTCPTGSDLDLSAASTDLRVQGELGRVTVKTASGDVELERARGQVEIKTASGDVSVQAILSQSSISTVSGDFEVGSLEGGLVGRSVSGDARVRVVRAPLAVTTTSGDVHLDRVEAGDVRVQSISGNARLAVGEGTPVWIDAVSVSGDLSSELGLQDQPGTEEESVVPLHVKTVSGDVSIVRAAQRAAAEAG